MEFVLAALKGLAAIPALIADLKSVQAQIKAYQDNAWLNEITSLRHQLDKAKTSEQYTDVAKKLHDLISRS